MFKTEDIAIPKMKYFLLRQLSRLGTLQAAGFCKSGSQMIHQKLFICIVSSIILIQAPTLRYISGLIL